ncbi:unnamed protein product, partial [Scytosiphon promiscuus]
MNTAEQQRPPGAGCGRSSRMCVSETEAQTRVEKPFQLQVAGSSPSAHVYTRSTSRGGGSDVARRRCRTHRSPFVTAVTFGVVLVGAAAVSSGSRNPPPPPPPPPSLGHQPNNNNGRQQDRWVGWTPPPPGPPPDPDGGAVGKGTEVAWGAGTQGSYASQGTAAGRQQGDGTVRDSGTGRPNGVANPGGIMDHTQHEHAAATGMAPGEAQRQVHGHTSMMGQQPGRAGPSAPAYPQPHHPQQQQHEQQQQVPPQWGQNGAQQPPQQQDQFYDEASNMAGTNGHNSGAMPTTPQAPVGGFLNRQQMDTAAGMG